MMKTRERCPVAFVFVGVVGVLGCRRMRFANGCKLIDYIYFKRIIIPYFAKTNNYENQ